MTWRIGSLFAGVGGLDLGLHAAGVGTTAWFSEYDKDASAVLAARFPEVPNHGDVTAIDWNEVEPVDVLVGGYPCQPFSFAGQRGGADDVRHLWPHFARALRLLRPRYAVLENVAGHLSLGFDAVLVDLAEAGFDAVWTTLRASDVGAPHRRERLFVVASDSERCEGGIGYDTDLLGRRATDSEQAGMGGGAGDGGPVTPTCPSCGYSLVAAGDNAWQCHRCQRLWPRTYFAPDTSDERHEWSGEPRGRRGRPADDGGEDASDADDSRLQGAEPAGRRLVPARSTPADAYTGGRGANEPDHAEGQPDSPWGAYAAAIDRWERLTRPAPAPVDDRGRLNAAFSEWMMGFPEGWVTDILPRNPALRCIGNAVQVQVAEVVGRWLLSMVEPVPNGGKPAATPR